jgi:hypothetical protein
MQEPVYRLSGLVAEVWLLTCHYLVLLILKSLGYEGAYRDLRKRHGRASENANVPWVAQGAERGSHVARVLNPC